MTRGDAVILLHGLARTSASMAPMARGLARHGFRVLNLDLPSRDRDIAALADYVEAASSSWRAAEGERCHLVGHSLGGLVARAWIARHRPPGLGRLVMLGPPNGGSEIADLLAPLSIYRRFFGPAGLELTTDEAYRHELLWPVDYPLGVIAGCRSLDPFGWWVLPRPNDGKVSVARTCVEGSTAHVTLPVTHALMMRAPAVIAATSRFLREGRF